MLGSSNYKNALMNGGKLMSENALKGAQNRMRVERYMAASEDIERGSFI